MRTVLALLLLISLLSGCRRVSHDRILARVPGKYVTMDGLAIVDVRTPSPATMSYSVAFGGPGGGTVGPIACDVAPGKWAFYIPNSNEVWFTGGDSFVQLIEHKGIAIIASDSRRIPDLLRRMPAEISRFLDQPNKAAEPTPAPVVAHL